MRLQPVPLCTILFAGLIPLSVAYPKPAEHLVGTWEIRTETSPMDDSKSVFAATPSIKDRMLFMIRCNNDEVSAFFHIPDGIDCQNNSATVRFGMGKATPEDFDVGGRNPDRGDLCLAVGFWGNKDTVPFLKSVGTSNKLAVRISSNRDFTGVFDLAGSKSAVAEVLQACGIPWDGSAS